VTRAWWTCIIQVLALFLRPKKEHKYRVYWNMYHHSVGYTVIVLGIVNIFKGMNILGVEQRWRTAYIAAVCVLLIAAATELFLGSLATGAHTAASRRGRRTVRAVHVRAAARAHRPTADFLLDCLAAEEEAPRARKTAGSAGGGGGGEAKPLPRGTRRIDAFFQKDT